MNMGLSKAAAETKVRDVSSGVERRWCLQRVLTPASCLCAQALCMPEYTDHVLRMTEARHKALSARIVYDALKKEVDLVRTFEASRRCDPAAQPRCWPGSGADSAWLRVDAGLRRS